MQAACLSQEKAVALSAPLIRKAAVSTASSTASADSQASSLLASAKSVSLICSRRTASVYVRCASIAEAASAAYDSNVTTSAGSALDCRPGRAAASQP